MTTIEVKLALILNDSARKASYKKRKMGLFKKVDQLNTLSRIEACAIVCSPYEHQPDVWPSPSRVQSAVSKFWNMSKSEQSKKMLNQETLLKQRIFKAIEQVKKLKRKNKRERDQMTLLMFDCLNAGQIVNITNIDLNDLAWIIDHNLKEIGQKMEILEKKAHVLELE